MGLVHTCNLSQRIGGLELLPSWKAPEMQPLKAIYSPYTELPWWYNCNTTYISNLISRNTNGPTSNVEQLGKTFVNRGKQVLWEICNAIRPFPAPESTSLPDASRSGAK